MHQQHRLLATEQRDRQEIIDRIEAQVVIERHADGVGVGGEQQGIAVGRRLDHDFAANHRALTGLVFDHDLVAKLFGQLLCDDAHGTVR